MKIRLYSDLHLEVYSIDVSTLDLTDVDVMVLAGDIHIGTKAVDWATQFDIPVIIVLGNHDHYDQDLYQASLDMKARAQNTNVHVLERDTLILGDVAFHGTTLWTDYALYGNPDMAKNVIQNCLLDFRRIKYNGSRITADDILTVHELSRDWLENSLAKTPDLTNIVVTHHAPSILSSHSTYQNDIVTSAFASDLSKLITTYRPDYWFHGHMHNPSTYMLGDTLVLANPRGYPRELLSKFDTSLTIEV